MVDDNPYATPKSEASATPEDRGELSADACENMAFLSRMLRCLAVCAAIAAIYPLLSVWAAQRYFGLQNQPTSWLIYVFSRLLFVPLGFLVARFGWRYARELKSCAASHRAPTESMIETQTQLGLCVCGGVFTLFLVFLLRMAYFLTADRPITTY